VIDSFIEKLTLSLFINSQSKTEAEKSRSFFQDRKCY
jgi:hypothetical protein